MPTDPRDLEPEEVREALEVATNDPPTLDNDEDRAMHRHAEIILCSHGCGRGVDPKAFPKYAGRPYTCGLCTP